MRKGEAGKTEKRRKGKGGSEEGAAPGSGRNALHLPPALAFKFPTSDLSQPAPAASPRKGSRAARPRMLQPAMFSGPASRAAQLSFEAGARGPLWSARGGRWRATRRPGSTWLACSGAGVRGRMLYFVRLHGLQSQGPFPLSASIPAVPTSLACCHLMNCCPPPPVAWISSCFKSVVCIKLGSAGERGEGLKRRRPFCVAPHCRAIFLPPPPSLWRSPAQKEGW